MRILWVNSGFLHPTTRGGQIRTLEMMKKLHERHEIHYAALDGGEEPEGPERAGEYSSKVHAFPHKAADKRSAGFVADVGRGVIDPVPVAVRRFYSRQMGEQLGRWYAEGKFDRAVCDFLAPAAHFPHLDRALLFQHNVETMIWRRHAEHAPDPLRKFYLGLQARRMFAFEKRVCREAGFVAAVSEGDAEAMRQLFQVDRVAPIPTGVDTDYFQPPAMARETATDLVFVGSMDWLPNDDGVTWFLDRILPSIRARRPKATVVIVGRKPSEKLIERARTDPYLEVTGTVPDVRPYLWKAVLSIVPLRIGGGTRLKIYESMAAHVPVVSTAVGAEGLAVRDGETIALADEPEAFAARCLELLDDRARRDTIAIAAARLVHDRFSWDEVARQFEEILIARTPPYHAWRPRHA